MECGLFDIREIFLSIDGIEITQGKLEYSTDPSEIGTMSAEDRGCPVASFRDPKTLVHNFNIEVTLATESFYHLNQLFYRQVYERQRKEDKYKPLVFNDGHGFKLETNNAIFTEMPSRNYVTEAEKVTFVIKAINCLVTMTPSWYNER